MNRRSVLTMLGAMATSLTLGSSTAAAERGGMQPIKGELPNENVPHESVHALPEVEETREVGQFLELRNGWAFPDCDSDVQEEFFNKTRQTFVYDGQTFVRDGFDDWEAYEVEDGRFVFTHADPPKPKGKTFDVTWDTVYTADFDPACVDDGYEAGDRHAGFPFESSYEIVTKKG